MQGVADDQQVVIDHHGQKKDIQYYIQYYRVYAKIHMADAPFIGYNFSLCVHQHLWNCGGNKTDGYQGQIREAEVCGYVEVGVWTDGWDVKQISEHSDYVHGGKKAQMWGTAVLVLLTFPEENLKIV